MGRVLHKLREVILMKPRVDGSSCGGLQVLGEQTLRTRTRESEYIRVMKHDGRRPVRDINEGTEGNDGFRPASLGGLDLLC